MAEEPGASSDLSILRPVLHEEQVRDTDICRPPPPAPIWPRSIRFVTADGLAANVNVRLSDKQPRNFKVASPVRRGVEYNEKTEVLAEIILFGILLDPNSMMTLTSRGEETHPIRLVLNLNRRHIEIFFPSWITSDNRKACRAFRFQIALDENFTIWRIPREGYVLHLASAPWYSKQLKEAIAQTHASNAKRWSIEDTWARQTDIVEHKSDVQYLNQTPISLHKTFNNINIARWTTFKIKVRGTASNLQANQVFENALRDFNVEIKDGSAFRFVRGPTPPAADLDAWQLVNGDARVSTQRSMIDEFSQPKLSSDVRYQLEVCISNGWLSEYTITAEFMSRLVQMDSKKAKQMLLFLDSYQCREFEPMKLFEDLKYRRPVKHHPLPEGCMEVRSATVTAVGIIYHTPAVEVTNRIIRKYKQYADKFLRVRFEDDAYRGQTRLYNSSNNKMIQIFQRVRRVLRHGIRIGDLHYEFLAWGNSQLREHGTYFFAKTGKVSASSIRTEMGAFDKEKVIAKRAARMGQCFSTTKAVALNIPTITEKNTIADITNNRVIDKVVYTDGVGKISPLAAQIVHQQLRIKGPVPSAFQFRLGGCKGVLVVWPDLPGVNIQVRVSQFKFDSSSNELEVIRWSEFWQPFLNRQIILCLSDLGVPDAVFLRMQHDTITALDAALKDDVAAVRALRDNIDPNGMTISMCELVTAGFRMMQEPFMMSIMHLWRAWTLKYLKEKAKIPIPKGAFVLGCADETGTLRGHFNDQVDDDKASFEQRIKNLPEIFLQVTKPQTGEVQVIRGVCILARNPSLHRGDIRVVNAVDVVQLRHLHDIVVMPTNGDRDLPSMCSGGDLDGDDYIVIWEPDLLPKEWNAEPFHYNPPTPRTATKEITTNDIIDFFYDYLQNDYLGRIAHAHLAAGDFLDEGIQSQTCLDLVQLHSMAVDYPKTGVPATMPRNLERNTYPHFMEKKPDSTYKSHKVLGQLYDAVERVAFNPTYNKSFDVRILRACQPTEVIMKSVSLVKHEYDNALQRIMAQHSIKTEFEVWSTFVIDHSKASRDYKFHEEIGALSKAIKDQYGTALIEIAGSKDHEKLLPVAVAAYQYTFAQVQIGLKEIKAGKRMEGSQGMPFISFPWLLQDTLCKIARDANDNHSSSRVAVVENGQVIEKHPELRFDQAGMAQLEVVDELDVDLPAFQNLAQHMPDPLHVDGRAADTDHDPFKGVELLESRHANPESKVSQETVAPKEAGHKTKQTAPLIELIEVGSAFSKADHHKNDREESELLGGTGKVISSHEVDPEKPMPSGTKIIDPFTSLRKQLENEGYMTSRTKPDRIRSWLNDIEDLPCPPSSSQRPQPLLDLSDSQEMEGDQLQRLCEHKGTVTDEEVPAFLADPLDLNLEQMKELGFDDNFELVE